MQGLAVPAFVVGPLRELGERQAGYSSSEHGAPFAFGRPSTAVYEHNPMRENRQLAAQARRRRAWLIAGLLVAAAVGLGAGLSMADGGSRHAAAHPGARSVAPLAADPRSRGPAGTVNVYSHTRVGMLTAVTRRARYLVYVPDSAGAGVYVINPRTYRVIDYFATGAVVQHVVPAWDLQRLYATNDVGNSLTPIDPTTGRRAGPNIPVDDPYNMYFTPDGRHAIVVEEGREILAFRDPHTFALQKALDVHCAGVDHMDFSADGTFAVASCEFSGQMVRIDLRTETVSGYLHVGGSPQDVKLSPDGRTFYVANRFLPALGTSGVQLLDARSFRLKGFIRTRLDAHGLYVSRDTRELYVTNRAGGAITVIDFATQRVRAVWPVPGTPDMGGVSPDGKTLWVSGRYSAGVYAISTTTGKVLASISVGVSPHGLCVWPQPGRYSTGHTGVMR
jgi:YVTN family beta-propeller protein